MSYRTKRKGPDYASASGRVIQRARTRAAPYRRAVPRRAIPSGELKFHDVDLDDAGISSGVSVTDSINKIAQGVTESTRVGRKCTIKSINWRYQIKMPQRVDSALGSDTVRVIMYLDKQANGAIAASTDLLETADYQSFNNLGNSGRFLVLHDKTVDMNAQNGYGNGTTNASGELHHSFTFFKKCDIPIEFSSTAGAITEIRSNNIGVFLISKDGTSTGVSFDSKIRLRFSDS